MEGVKIVATTAKSINGKNTSSPIDAEYVIIQDKEPRQEAQAAEKPARSSEVYPKGMASRRAVWEGRRFEEETRNLYKVQRLVKTATESLKQLDGIWTDKRQKEMADYTFSSLQRLDAGLLRQKTEGNESSIGAFAKLYADITERSGSLSAGKSFLDGAKSEKGIRLGSAEFVELEFLSGSLDKLAEQKRTQASESGRLAKLSEYVEKLRKEDIIDTMERMQKSGAFAALEADAERSNRTREVWRFSTYIKEKMASSASVADVVELARSYTLEKGHEDVPDVTTRSTRVYELHNRGKKASAQWVTRINLYFSLMGGTENGGEKTWVQEAYDELEDGTKEHLAKGTLSIGEGIQVSKVMLKKWAGKNKGLYVNGAPSDKEIDMVETISDLTIVNRKAVKAFALHLGKDSLNEIGIGDEHWRMLTVHPESQDYYYFLPKGVRQKKIWSEIEDNFWNSFLKGKLKNQQKSEMPPLLSVGLEEEKLGGNKPEQKAEGLPLGIRSEAQRTEPESQAAAAT